MSAPPDSALTEPVPQRAAPSRPARGAAKRPPVEPPTPTRDIDQVRSALNAIARTMPSPLLAPWLPGALGALSRRGERR